MENCFISKNSLLLELHNQSHLMNIIGENDSTQLQIFDSCIQENYCFAFHCQQYTIQITDKYRYYNPLWWLLQETHIEAWKMFLFICFFCSMFCFVFFICFLNNQKFEQNQRILSYFMETSFSALIWVLGQHNSLQLVFCFFFY